MPSGVEQEVKDEAMNQLKEKLTVGIGEEYCFIRIRILDGRNSIKEKTGKFSNIVLEKTVKSEVG